MFFELGGHVVRGGHVAAEHHGGIAVFDQAFHVGDEGCELGIASFAGEALGLCDEGLQACGVLQGGVGVVQLACRLQVVAMQVVGGAVVQAVVTQQVVFATAQVGGFAFQPGCQGLDCRRRGRGHAA